MRPTSAAVCVVSNGSEDIFDLAVLGSFSLHFHWLAVFTISFYANVRLRLARHAYRGFPDDWLRWRFKRFQRRSDPKDFFGFPNPRLARERGEGVLSSHSSTRGVRGSGHRPRAKSPSDTRRSDAHPAGRRACTTAAGHKRGAGTLRSRLFERVFYAPFLCRGGVLHFLVAELHVA